MSDDIDYDLLGIGPCQVCGEYTEWRLEDHHECGDMNLVEYSGWVCEDHQCPECEGFGQQAYSDPIDPMGTCRTCGGWGYLKEGGDADQYGSEIVRLDKKTGDGNG